MTEILSEIRNRPKGDLDLAKVIKFFYPNFSLGNWRDPADEILQLIETNELTVHASTFGKQRPGASRQEAYNPAYLARVLLLSALKDREDWSTPTVGNVMKTFVPTTIELNRDQHTVWGMRKSEGLTTAASTALQQNARIVRLFIRGVRTDGAYFALENSDARNELCRVFGLYLADYFQQPPSIIGDMSFAKALEHATWGGDPKEIYACVYGQNSARKIGAVVPYELEYWQWLIDTGLVDAQNHLPFTERMIRTYAKGRSVQDDLARVQEETGVKVNEHTGQVRYWLIEKDLPENCF